MAIVGSLPVVLSNGSVADATGVMTDMNYIASAVNGGALGLTGGSLSGPGNLVIGGTLWVSGVSSFSGQVGLDGTPAGNQRVISASTGGSLRWQLALANNVAESGGNAGSDVYLNRYSDAGVFIDSPLVIRRSSGVATFSQAIVNGPSDGRLKENVEALAGALGKVERLRGVSFNFIGDVEKRRQIGLIAQDVAGVVPEVIQAFGEDQFGLDYPKLVALLIEAVKDLSGRVALLEGSDDRKNSAT